MKNITLEEQMELTLGKTSAPRKIIRKSPPRRAGWWFGQMRQAADRALDWKPRPAPPSHQVYLALHRQEPHW